MKTVYVLGAGFSAPAGAPVMGDFIPGAEKIVEDLLEHYRDLLVKQDRKLSDLDDRIDNKRYEIAKEQEILEELNPDETIANIDNLKKQLRKLKEKRKENERGVNWRKEKIAKLERLLRDVGGLSKDIEGYASNIQVDVNNLEQLFCLLDIPVDEEENRNRETLLDLITVAFADICHRYPDRPCRDNDAVAVDADLLKVVGETPYCTFSNKLIKACHYRAFLSNIIQRHERVIRESFDEDGERTQDRNIYDDLDAIISLNYDLVLERAAAHFFRKEKKDEKGSIIYGDNNIRLFYGGGENTGNSIDFIADYETVTSQEMSFLVRQIYWKSSEAHKNWLDRKEVLLPILKIHGSLNWFYGDETRDSRSLLYLGEPGIPDWTKTPGAKNVTAIIPPTWNRQLITGSIFQKLISDAIRHIRKAKRIVFIGYSIPNTDTYFKYILAKGLSDRTYLPEIEYWQWIDDSLRTEDVIAKKEGELKELFNPRKMGSNRVKVIPGGIKEFVERENRTRDNR